MKLRIMELFRSWLALEGAVPPGSARAQMSKHQHTELRDRSVETPSVPAKEKGQTSGTPPIEAMLGSLRYRLAFLVF